MAEITAASQEQSAGIAQVKQTILEMDETTQQNAALVEEAAAAAASMQEQAANLARVVSIFKVDSERRTAANAPVSTVQPPPALRKQIAASPKAERVARQEPELVAAEEC